MTIELGELVFFSLRAKEDKKKGVLTTEVTLKVNPQSQETIDAIEHIVMSERLKVVLEVMQPHLI